MTDCLFCRIIAGEIPAKKVFEDQHTFAFEDLHPQAPTHVLVIPKRHIESLNAVSPDEDAIIGEVVIQNLGGLGNVGGRSSPRIFRLCDHHWLFSG